MVGFAPQVAQETLDSATSLLTFLADPVKAQQRLEVIRASLIDLREATAQNKKSLEELQQQSEIFAQLSAREAALQSGVADLEQQKDKFEKYVATVKEALYARDAAVKEREVDLNARSGDLAVKETDFAARNSRLAAALADWKKREQVLTEREQRLEAALGTLRRV
jgi:ethanolamine utilization microcompartment shell protein EutL